MTTIGLIRHGITEWNVLGKAQGSTDIPLNETGRQQALEMGERLFHEEKWDLMISSDLMRAKETAMIIGNRINLPILHVDERIREISCGEVEGTTEEQHLSRWGQNWRELELGGERPQEVSERGVDFLHDITKTYSGKRILVVSHGACIGLTLQRLLPERFHETYIDNTSITILKHTEEEWGCLLYNCTQHLKSIEV
ncbi:histidine phosphatase family protein [Rossellomorea aquimaris]|uniref:histidine phosphatase family protein n=1 Tax=Rossellomorea aquimaris TaxID=189382 RepID=UPI001CD1BE30|nr:histidine phosphatase family protein [Rossellomorea aquimaris]MCA1054040.1 histidine phosphatase family protein [Rossellomorea aquimaris]